MDGCEKVKAKQIFKELVNHLPYSIFATAAGFILAALLTYGSIVSEHSCGGEEHHAGAAQKVRQPARLSLDQREPESKLNAEEHADHKHQHEELSENPASGVLFHIFHPIHLLLSAMATTAMFYRHENHWLKAILVGTIGSLGVCGISDIFLPYVSGQLLSMGKMHFHWCVIEHPQLIVPFTAVGVLSGLMAARTIHHSTVISHSAHTLTSCAASLFYLISFGIADWYTADHLGLVFIIVILAVTIPCCLSDIVFPLLVVRGEGEDCSFCIHTHSHEEHDHEHPHEHG